MAPEVEAAMDVLKKPMNSFCLVSDFSFREVVQQWCINDGMDPNAGVYILLKNSPYNTRSAQDLQNSEYDSPTRNGMVEVVQLEEKVGAPGGPGHIFCSALQSWQW